MKIALYIEDGLEQIVLTPQNDTEKAILGKLTDESRELSIKMGGFFACRGGWMRQADPYGANLGKLSDDASTMIVLTAKKPSEAG